MRNLRRSRRLGGEHGPLLLTLCTIVTACAGSEGGGSGSVAASGGTPTAGAGGARGGASAGSSGASNGGSSGNVGEPSGGSSGTAASGGQGLGGFAGSPAVTGGTGGVEPCSAAWWPITTDSSGRVDVVWVLDNSGSMFDEAVGVQNNLNAFHASLTDRGVDPHIVILSSGPPVQIIPGVITLDNGVCIEPPLGTPGACPSGDDSNVAGGYLHHRVTIGSNDALLQIQNTFASWSDMLRPDATKTFIVVTDDDALPSPTAADFIAWVNAQPELMGAGWNYSGIYCMPDMPVSSNCASLGSVHAELVLQTGGLAIQLSQPDWPAAMQALANHVAFGAGAVACSWTIPPPPQGETFDPDRVNLRLARADGTSETIYLVPGPGACRDEWLGWYYDDPTNPLAFSVCPASCATLRSDPPLSISLAIGCATEPSPDP